MRPWATVFARRCNFKPANFEIFGFPLLSLLAKASYGGIPQPHLIPGAIRQLKAQASPARYLAQPLELAISICSQQGPELEKLPQLDWQITNAVADLLYYAKIQLGCRFVSSEVRHLICPGADCAASYSGQDVFLWICPVEDPPVEDTPMVKGVRQTKIISHGIGN
jgi:hypothetical protein